METFLSQRDDNGWMIDSSEVWQDQRRKRIDSALSIALELLGGNDGEESSQFPSKISSKI